MLLGFVLEHLERAGCKPGGAVGMLARSAAPHLLDPASQLLPLVEALSRRKPFKRTTDCVESVHAGSALTGAGIGQVPHRPSGLADAAGARRQDDDRAGAEPGASRPQVGFEQERVGSAAPGQWPRSRRRGRAASRAAPGGQRKLPQGAQRAAPRGPPSRAGIKSASPARVPAARNPRQQRRSASWPVSSTFTSVGARRPRSKGVAG